MVLTPTTTTMMKTTGQGLLEVVVVVVVVVVVLMSIQVRLKLKGTMQRTTTPDKQGNKVRNEIKVIHLRKGC